MIKVGWLRWLGKLFRMQEDNHCRELTLHKPEGTQRVGGPAIGWLDSIEEALNTMDLEIENESHTIGTTGEQWQKRPTFFTYCSSSTGGVGGGSRRRGAEDLILKFTASAI
jgi:hypothetical protein